MLKQNDELIQFLPCGAGEKQDSTYPILPIFHSQGTLHLPIFPSLIVLYCYPEECTQIIEFVTVRHSDKVRNQMYFKIVQHNLEQALLR